MSTTKVCNVCSEWYTLSEFHKDSSSKDGLRSTCKLCAKKRAQENHLANPLRAKDYNLRRYYGISLADYLKMLEAQNGRCKICGTDAPGGKGTFHVDHCHDSSKVRGLLCRSCNVGLGHFNDNISLLSLAILYLNEHHDHSAPSHKSDAHWHRPSPRCFPGYCKS
jgi:hypothetical protein